MGFLWGVAIGFVIGWVMFKQPERAAKVYTWIKSFFVSGE